MVRIWPRDDNHCPSGFGLTQVVMQQASLSNSRFPDDTPRRQFTTGRLLSKY